MTTTIHVSSPTGVPAVDTANINTAFSTAIPLGASVSFAAGTYVISQAVPITNAVGITIRGEAGTVITYPSDDTILSALNRCGFLLTSCTDVTIEGLTFLGGNAREITTVNLGVGVYATQCTGLRVHRCVGTSGAALFAQDNTVNDRGTVIEACRSYGCRAPMGLCDDSTVIACEFRQPAVNDATGEGDSFSASGGTVTLTDALAEFTTDMVGRYVVILGATTSTNNGRFKITAVPTPKTLTYTNGSGATEAFGGTWWIPAGDLAVSIGAGGGAIAVSGGTVTLTVADPVFAGSMVDASVRIADATTASNNGHFRVTAVLSATRLQYQNAGGASEGFAGSVTVDGYDNIIDGSTYGSSHAIYVFGGRERIKVVNCTFEGIRTVCVKASGSSSPLRDIVLSGNIARECGAFAVWGADDSQEHTDISATGNSIVDCATGRPGWSESIALVVLGSRGSIVAENRFTYTRNAFASQTGTLSVASNYAIQAVRYKSGVSQPLESFVCERNTFTAHPQRTTPTSLLAGCIMVAQCGIRAKWGSGGTLTGPVGGVMTLTDSTALFSDQDVGALISLRFAPNLSNNVTDAVILSASGTTVTFANGGVGGGVSAGTYRISPQPANARGGLCCISDNRADGVTGGYLATLDNCVAAEIQRNVWSRGNGIRVDGCVGPRIVGNREVAPATNQARIRIGPGNAFPFVDDNITTNPALGSGTDGTPTNTQCGMGITTDGTGTKVDYPLLGKRGRCLPTGGKPQLLIAYGAGHVDGDTISINGTALTYKAVSPGAWQFNDWASFVALATAVPGLDAKDYGSQFTPSVDTQHALVYTPAPTTAVNGYYIDTIRVLNPTGLVVLRNGTAAGEAMQYARGEQQVGPVADKSVAWSTACGLEAGGQLTAKDTNGQALLNTAGYYAPSDASDDGVCQVFRHANAAGNEELRWYIP